MDKLKCFLYDGLHILKKCLKKFTLFKKKKLVGKALGLGRAKRVSKPRRPKARRSQWSASCVMVYIGCGSRAKRSKKKRVKCFLCRGSHELRNCPKQAVVKGKATSKLGESSKGLPPKEKVSLSSNLEEKVMMKIVKLGLMRLNSREGSELFELSTRLPLIGEVGSASNFKEKKVMQVEQLTRVNATSRTVRVKKQHKPRQKSRRKGKANVLRRDRGKSSQCHSDRSRNEDVTRMGGGECHGQQFKAHDYSTKCICWRSIV
ncbi:hypothetical protein PVK06_020848 [Gossypium arboreum]|uniref:Uncharacterized protein n=1 Tax=Gossypium arboreum TaxID=29729 RepID=A0ABR0PNG4_GOSAR|nr:hypothetical protein PVK06_020848 [Gossypium arboreum]